MQLCGQTAEWLVRCRMSKPGRTCWSQGHVYLQPLLPASAQLALEASPTSVLWTYSQQVLPPGKHPFVGILVTGIWVLLGVCFALLLLLKSSSIDHTSTSTVFSLSQKPVGSICRQERKESIDFLKNWHPGLGEDSDATREISVELLVASPVIFVIPGRVHLPHLLLRRCGETVLITYAIFPLGSSRCFFVYLAQQSQEWLKFFSGIPSNLKAILPSEERPP